MDKKPRGSQKGLLESRRATKERNTEQLWRQIETLRKQKSGSTWSYKEVWVGAGLKSNVALNSPWNSHVRAAIDQHNTEVREAVDLGTIGYRQRKTLRAANRELREVIATLTKERDMALSQIAVYRAEADHYKAEADKLNNQLARLKSRTHAV